MEKFLQQMQNDIEGKILSCVKGESIVKPFSQVYERAVTKKAEETPEDRKGKYVGDVYLGDDSIYTEIVQEYLQKNPGYFSEDEEKE